VWLGWSAAGRLSLPLVVAVLASCGGPSSASPSPSPSASTSANGTSLACKLPISYPPKAGDLEGGWVTFPGGQTQGDADAIFRRSGNLLRSNTQPTLSGDGPIFYDRARSRWVPVGKKAVSDDGVNYGYMDPGNAQNTAHQTLHLVVVATAQDRVITLPSLPAFTTWGILEYTGSRIYLRQVGFEGPGPPGLWWLDPATGQVHKLFDDRTPAALQGQTAWFETVNPADGQAITNQQSGTKLPDQVERRDLQSGATVLWLYRPGSVVEVVGLDNADHPFVAVSKGQSPTDAMELVVLNGPSAAGRIYQATVAEIDGLTVNFTDQHGTWFGGDRGISLYADGTFRQVSSTGARPAGRCA
jgi:hypothetical protein